MILGRPGEHAADESDFANTLIGLRWDESEHDDTWLVSYADIISTLLAMVVLLFGRIALTSPTVAAPADPTATVASNDPMDEPLERIVALARLLPLPSLPSLLPLPPPTPAASPQDRLAELVESRFEGRIKAERRDEGLVLTIPEVALFESGRSALQTTAIPLLAELAATLREVGEAQISVEGHTDDRPVQGGEFHSNWDLAAARANAVTHYLIEQGFAPKRLHSVSFADTRPVADNATPEGRAANRRVELKIEFEAGAGAERADSAR